MDHNDREQFWKTLCSLPGNDIVAEREQPALPLPLSHPSNRAKWQMGIEATTRVCA